MFLLAIVVVGVVDLKVGRLVVRDEVSPDNMRISCLGNLFFDQYCSNIVKAKSN